MVEQLAPKCMHCNRSTWDPSQKCIDHRHMTSPPTDRQQTQVPMGSAQQVDATTKAVVHDTIASFPELGNNFNLQSVRGVAAQSLRDSVSIEVYRVFPYSNVADPGERQKRLEYTRQALVENSKLQPVHMTSDDAIGLRDSSIDVYGMGHEEGVGLASYAIANEWKLGRQMGVPSDENGVSYDLDLPEFMERQQPFASQVVEDEFRRQLINYSKVIEVSTKRPPVNPSPVVVPWSPSMDEVATQRTSDEEAAAQAKFEKNMEIAKLVGNIALRTGKGLFSMTKSATGAVKSDFDTRYSAASEYTSRKDEGRKETVREEANRKWQAKLDYMHYKDMRKRGIR